VIPNSIIDPGVCRSHCVATALGMIGALAPLAIFALLMPARGVAGFLMGGVPVAARELLGEGAFAEAWVAGRGLSVEEVVSRPFARGDLQRS
jgi:hypothetical protein